MKSLGLPKLSTTEIRNYLPKTEIHLEVGPRHERSEEWIVYNTSDLGPPIMADMVDFKSYSKIANSLAYMDQERRELVDFIETSGLEGSLESHVLNKYPLEHHPDSPDTPLFLIERGLNNGTMFMSLSDIVYVAHRYSSSRNTLYFTRQFITSNWKQDSSEEKAAHIFFVNLKGRINNTRDKYEAYKSHAFDCVDLEAKDWGFVDFGTATGTSHEVRYLNIYDALEHCN